MMATDYKELLITWETDLRIACHGHYEAASKLVSYTYWLGIPVIIVSTVVGTAIFSSLEKSPDNCLKITFGIISILNAVLASLQTFLKFPERAEKHRKAGGKFASILKELEQKMVFANSEDIEIWCDDFRKRWDKISNESSTVPKRIWKRQIAKQLKRKKEKYGK